MGVRSLNHVGVVVDDLDAAIAFFVALGLRVSDRASVEGTWVDRVIGLEGVRSEIVSITAAESDVWLELTKFRSPPAAGVSDQPAANQLGLRHVAFVLDDIDGAVERLREMGYDTVGDVQEYEGVYRLCYVRGPEGIIVELAEELAAHTSSEPGEHSAAAE